MKKSRYGKLSILIILIATLFISAAIALFGLSTNDLTGANSSAEITAPEKSPPPFPKIKGGGYFLWPICCQDGESRPDLFSHSAIQKRNNLPRVQVAAGEKLPSPVPLVMFFSTAQATACA